MNIGRLRALIANLPDDAPILIYGRDHRFVEGSAYVDDVVRVKLSTRSHEYHCAADYEPSEDEPPVEPRAALIVE